MLKGPNAKHSDTSVTLQLVYKSCPLIADKTKRHFFLNLEPFTSSYLDINTRD